MRRHLHIAGLLKNIKINLSTIETEVTDLNSNIEYLEDELNELMDIEEKYEELKSNPNDTNV